MTTIVPIPAVNFKGVFDKVARLYFFGVRIESVMFPDRHAVVSVVDLNSEERKQYPTEEEYLGRITQDAQRMATIKYFVNGPEDIKAVSLASLAEFMQLNFQYSALLYDSKHLHPYKGKN